MEKNQTVQGFSEVSSSGVGRLAEMKQLCDRNCEGADRTLYGIMIRMGRDEQGLGKWGGVQWGILLSDLSAKPIKFWGVRG